MILFRTMGKLSFAQLRDGSDDIQIAFVKDLCSFNTGKEIQESCQIAGSELSAYKIVEKYIDVGDFIGVK
jgi:lysyl-tRNA synthetase class II